MSYWELTLEASSSYEWTMSSRSGGATMSEYAIVTPDHGARVKPRSFRASSVAATWAVE